MLACIGYTVPEYARVQGYLNLSEGFKFSEVPNGLAAFSKVPGRGWSQMITFISVVEYGALPHFGFKKTPNHPSDQGFGFLGASGSLRRSCCHEVSISIMSLANQLENGYAWCGNGDKTCVLQATFLSSGCGTCSLRRKVLFESWRISHSGSLHSPCPACRACIQ